MTQLDAPLAVDSESDIDAIPDSDADLVVSEEDVLEEDDDLQEKAAESDSDDDAVEGYSVYRKLVYYCSPRWTKTYKKRPENDQIELVAPVKKERISLADYLYPPIDYVVGTASRGLGETMANLLLVKCDVSLYWKRDEEVERPLTAEYEACITRCHDMDFIEIRLRAEYGDAAFAKHFPCRYLEYDWDTFHVVNKRQFYVDKLRSIENRWNAACARAALPPIYIEDWTEERADDETLELIEFINYLANSTVVAGLLPQYRQLENMKCKSSCGACVAKCREEGVPRCCGKRASINIDRRTKEFAWCEDGERGARPLFMHFECAPECECGSKCENREVQNGRQMPLCVFREPGTGWGVRTLRPIDDGAFVTEYCGEVNVAGQAGDAARYDFAMKNRVRDPASGDVLHKHLVISAAVKGNEARFFNHSCAPNMHTECTVIERYGIFYHHVSFFTDRRIIAGEELKFDYFPHIRRASSETREMFESCRCGSFACRFLASSSSSFGKDGAPKRRRADDDVALLSSDDDSDDEEDTRREKRRKASDATGVLGKRVGPPTVHQCSSNDAGESQDSEMRVLTARKAPPSSCSSSDWEEDMVDEDGVSSDDEEEDMDDEVEEEDCPVPVARESNDDSEGLDEMLDGIMMDGKEEEDPAHADRLDTMLAGRMMDGSMMDQYLPEYSELSPHGLRMMARKTGDGVTTTTRPKCPSSYRYESDSGDEASSPPRKTSTSDYGRMMVVLPPRERRAVDEGEAVDQSEPHTAPEVPPPSSGDDVEDPALAAQPPTTPDRPAIEGLLGIPEPGRAVSQAALTTTTPSRSTMTGEELGTPARARTGRPIGTTPIARSPVGRDYERSPDLPPPRSFDREEERRRVTAMKRVPGMSDDESSGDEEEPEQEE